MKNKFKNILLCIVASLAFMCSATSCGDFLDVDEYFYDQMSLDSAFSKREYVEGWFSNAFEHMASDIGEWRGNFKYASDDMFTYDQGSSKDYQNGNYSAENQLGEDNLGRLYEAVRKASTFLNNVHKCKELSYTEVADYQGQARFLRAYAYWALLRKYGPIPIIPEEGLDVSLSYEELSLPRAHFDDVVDVIEKDLIQAARVLPSVRPVNNLGRPTRGAALALRARVLLYAASPLFNGNEDFYNLKDKEGNVLVSLEYDESKW
ncbi:MAG: RagB/SusD family nutrient uptake outer membrane protein, partial [Bacteroidaceae bacterium]